MSKEVVLGFVRHLLTFGGGYVVAQGWTDTIGMQEAVGALVTLTGFLWSAFAPEKKPSA